MEDLNIEEPGELLAYLRRAGHLDAAETPAMERLPGGVSNRTVRVQRTNGESFVIKQALEKLRVLVDWHSDPSRSHREALGLHWLTRLAPAGTITPLLFEDMQHHLVAMAAVPQPHENWKTRLLAGVLDDAYVGQFGELLGAIHRRARDHRSELAVVFDGRTFFETLRIEPYYSFAASRNPAASSFFAQLLSETRATRETLVHGDYSPKNILVHRDALVLLDHEVVHWGDPAFDLGFSLAHLLSKAHHLEPHRAAFLGAAELYWRSYCEAAGEFGRTEGLQDRAARHTLGCLLARVDGRSPLEYLTEAERSRQREIVLALMHRPPKTVPALIAGFAERLEQSH
jgi:aminoglycoside phosphotransferase (APT) family kinase protein